MTPLVAVAVETELVYLEIGLAGAPSPAWAERAAEATVVPRGSSAEFGCERSCWVHVVATPERAVEVVDAVAVGLRVPGGTCTAAIVGPITPRMVRRTRRALRGCRPGDPGPPRDEVWIPSDARTAALLAAAPGGLLRDRLRAEGLVYTVEREVDGVAFVVRAEDRPRAESIVAEVLGAIPAVTPERWAEADRVLEMDRRIAMASPGALARYIEARLVAGLGAPPLGE